MPDELKREFLTELQKFHRVVYGLLIAIMICAAIEDRDGRTASLIYAGGFVGLFIMDSFILVPDRYENMNKHVYRGRTFGIETLVCGGLFFTVFPPVVLTAVFTYLMLLLFEDMMLNDIFDRGGNLTRRVVSGVIIAVCLCAAYAGEYSVEAVVMSICAAVLITLYCWYILKVHMDAAKAFDDRYTNLYFSTSDILEENKKLIQFQEKVEKVNNEINYQKINLTKANSDLEKRNAETHSLIEVMKFFSSNFNVPKNANRMLDNVVDMKKPALAAFYMEPGTYMNEAPFLEIKTENEDYRQSVKREVGDIFRNMQELKQTEPVFIVRNHEKRKAFLIDTGAANIAALPAVENNVIYGVLILMSNRIDFFEDGFSFYESSLMDFTSALISDRLYMTTEDMAKKDGLTKIYNRIYFNHVYPQMCESVVATGGTLSVAMMDIDHFKNVNDTYGHLAGDEVIKMVAGTDDAFAKKYSGTAVRFGGEEFLLILPGCGLEEASRIVAEMHKTIAETVVHYEDLDIRVNTSMGIANYPETTGKISEVVDRSDHAMYYSKEHGRARITVDGREGDFVPDPDAENRETEKTDEVKTEEKKESREKENENSGD